MVDDVIETLRRKLPLRPEEISGRTPLRKLIRDSLDAIELIALLSERYGVDIEPDDLARLETVDDVASYVKRRRRKGSRSGERRADS